MKQYLTVALALVCAVLVVALIVIKHVDNAQQAGDVGAIADFSNQLDSAQMQIALCNGRIIEFSNSLDQCQSAALTLSNQLNDAQSTVALDAGQVTNLNQQVAEMKSEMESSNQTFSLRVTDLTNQVARLTTRLALTETNLVQADKNYASVEYGLRRDVAARLVVEQKFHDPAALQSQLEYLKQNPEETVSAQSIYAGLDLEVTSNGVHVISSQ